MTRRVAGAPRDARAQSVALALIDAYAMARRESATHIPTAGTPPGCVGEYNLVGLYAVGQRRDDRESVLLRGSFYEPRNQSTNIFFTRLRSTMNSIPRKWDTTDVVG